MSHFSVKVQESIGAPLDAVFQAWSTAAGWDLWFTKQTVMDFQVGGRYSNEDKDQGVYTKIVEPSDENDGESALIEFTWENAEHCPGSIVSVEFIEMRPSTLVVITHSGLPDEKGVEDMRDGWTWALASLKSALETGTPLKYAEWKDQQG